MVEFMLLDLNQKVSPSPALLPHPLLPLSLLNTWVDCPGHSMKLDSHERIPSPPGVPEGLALGKSLNPLKACCFPTSRGDGSGLDGCVNQVTCTRLSREGDSAERGTPAREGETEGGAQRERAPNAYSPCNSQVGGQGGSPELEPKPRSSS